MKLHQLRCFLAVSDSLHFSRAAELLHLSQPALSLQVSSLEESLGVKLFDRSHRSTTLTRAGALLRDEVRDVIPRLERAVTRARMAAEGRLGRLRVGVISTAAAEIVPPLVSDFRRTRPEIQLELRHALTAEQVAMLRDGALDVGFVRTPIAEQGELRVIPVHREPLELFLPTSHALAHRRRLRLQQLDGQEFVLYARRNAPGFHAFLRGLLRKAGATPAAIHEADDMYTLSALVSAGLGVAIAPASIVSYRVAGVAVAELEGCPPSEIAVAIRKDIEHPAAIAFVRAALAASRLSAAPA